MLNILPAQNPSDIALIQGLLHEYIVSWHSYPGPVPDDEVARARRHVANLPAHCSPPQGRLFLATYAGQPAGCVAIQKVDDQTCEMKRLYVKPDFRGRKIGRALAQHAIQQARTLGYQKIRLHTIALMQEANQLYQSLGFAPIAPFEQTARPDAVFLQLNL